MPWCEGSGASGFRAVSDCGGAPDDIVEADGVVLEKEGEGRWMWLNWQLPR